MLSVSSLALFLVIFTTVCFRKLVYFIRRFRWLFKTSSWHYKHTFCTDTCSLYHSHEGINYQITCLQTLKHFHFSIFHWVTTYLLLNFLLFITAIHHKDCTCKHGCFIYIASKSETFPTTRVLPRKINSIRVSKSLTSTAHPHLHIT